MFLEMPPEMVAAVAAVLKAHLDALPEHEPDHDIWCAYTYMKARLDAQAPRESPAVAATLLLPFPEK